VIDVTVGDADGQARQHDAGSIEHFRYAAAGATGQGILF
jgi:hypothetical protein